MQSLPVSLLAFVLLLVCLMDSLNHPEFAEIRSGQRLMLLNANLSLSTETVCRQPTNISTQKHLHELPGNTMTQKVIISSPEH